MQKSGDFVIWYTVAIRSKTSHSRLYFSGNGLPSNCKCPLLRCTVNAPVLPICLQFIDTARSFCFCLGGGGVVAGLNKNVPLLLSVLCQLLRPQVKAKEAVKLCLSVEVLLNLVLTPKVCIVTNFFLHEWAQPWQPHGLLRKWHVGIHLFFFVCWETLVGRTILVRL